MAKAPIEGSEDRYEGTELHEVYLEGREAMMAGTPVQRSAPTQMQPMPDTTHGGQVGKTRRCGLWIPLVAKPTVANRRERDDGVSI
jgi:hypothetical protein